MPGAHREKAPESLSYNYEWQELLYEIYRDWGQREQQIGQARKLALCGYRKFYETTKALLIEDGRWQEAFPQLLTELKTALPARQYMEILAQENETALLMEQVRVYQDTVFQYGGILASQYGEEICEMCSAVIRQTAKRIDNRRDYHNLCELLCSLVDFGGIAAAQTLIAELHQAYPAARRCGTRWSGWSAESGKSKRHDGADLCLFRMIQPGIFSRVERTNEKASGLVLLFPLYSITIVSA